MRASLRGLTARLLYVGELDNVNNKLPGRLAKIKTQMPLLWFGNVMSDAVVGADKVGRKKKVAEEKKPQRNVKAVNGPVGESLQNISIAALKPYGLGGGCSLLQCSLHFHHTVYVGNRQCTKMHWGACQSPPPHYSVHTSAAQLHKPENALKLVSALKYSK